MKKILFNLIAFGVPGVALHAQTAPEWVAFLPKPETSGFHLIVLPPEVSCRISGGGGNFRLLRADGTEVPYITGSENQISKEYHALAEAGRRTEKGAFSSVVFHCPEKALLDELTLHIRNTDAEREFWLSGSDDQINWYIIQENYRLQPVHGIGSYDYAIRFPPSDYAYYKIEIRHGNREPVQVTGAGYYIQTWSSPGFEKLPGPEIRQHEDAHSSVIDITWDYAHYADHIRVLADGPEYYHRSAVLQEEYTRADGQVAFRDLTHFTLSSKYSNSVPAGGVRARHLRMVIQNGDDVPLRITGIEAVQKRRQFIASLEAGKVYEVWIGPEDQPAPRYDLKYFRDDIPASLREVRPDSISPALPVNADPDVISGKTVLRGRAPEAQGEQSAQKYFLWGAILLIAALLIVFSIRILKDKE